MQLSLDVLSLVDRTKENLGDNANREHCAWRLSRTYMVIRRCSHGPKDSNIRRTAGLRARSRAVCPKQSWRLASALCNRNKICTQFSCPAAELRCRAGERPIENNCSRWVVHNWTYRVGSFASVSKRGLIIFFPGIYSVINQCDRGNLNEERYKQRK